jgi:hypothetical protein
MPSLGEVLYWGACWIAAIVALLGLAAWITGSAESWVGVTAFLAVAGAIWVMGRVALSLANARIKTRR